MKRHRSPLHQLFHTFEVKPADYETITPASCPPNRKDNLWTHVTVNREDSRDEDLSDEAEAHVYADGSGMDGMAGAAAVLYRGGTEVASLHYQLGLLTWHTTYEVEIAGVILALQLVHNDNTANTVLIRLDNQAVVQALVSWRAKPAHSLLDKVHGLCDAWRREDRQQRKPINISWISGHDGVTGNEQADIKAKRAIKEGSSPGLDLPLAFQGEELLCSITVASSAFKDDLFKRWKLIWSKSPRCRHMDKIDAKMPSHSFLQATDSLTRAQASVLMQLQTSHAPLSMFLH